MMGLGHDGTRSIVSTPEWDTCSLKVTPPPALLSLAFRQDFLGVYHYTLTLLGEARNFKSEASCP